MTARVTPPDEGGRAAPRPPERIEPIGPAVAGLAVSGPARAGGFLVEGEAVTVQGTLRGALETVWIGPRVVASDVRGADGAVANVVAHPGLLRRERIGRGGTQVETILAAPTLPLLAVQIEARGGDPPAVTMDLHAGDGWTPRSAPGYVALEAPDGSLLAVGAAPAGTVVELAGGGATGVRAVVRAARAGETITVLLAAGAEARVHAALAGAAHLAAHARAAAEGGVEDGFRLVTGVAEIDEGLPWARARLGSALARAEREGAVATASAPLWAGLAALAVGDARGAERALRQALAAVRRGPVDAASAESLGLLADQAILSVGAGGPLAELARAISSALAARPSAPGGREGARPGRRLPVVTPASGGDRPSEALRALLAGEAGAPTREHAFPPVPVVALGATFRSDPDAAWTRWRRALAEGLDDGPAGIATWDPVEATPERIAPGTAALLLAVVHGLLGVGPDAPVGRLRLAPRLPSHIVRLRAEGLSVGAARLSFDYAREGPRHRFTIEPALAAVPPVVVFEPAVAGTVREVRIDGATAELDPRREDVRTVVPVQLPVDGPRTVEVLTEGGASAAPGQSSSM